MGAGIKICSNAGDVRVHPLRGPRPRHDEPAEPREYGQYRTEEKDRENVERQFDR